MNNKYKMKKMPKREVGGRKLFLIVGNHLLEVAS